MKQCPFTPESDCSDWCPMYSRGDCLFAQCARKLIRVGEMIEELDQDESET